MVQRHVTLYIRLESLFWWQIEVTRQMQLVWVSPGGRSPEALLFLPLIKRSATVLSGPFVFFRLIEGTTMPRLLTPFLRPICAATSPPEDLRVLLAIFLLSMQYRSSSRSGIAQPWSSKFGVCVENNTVMPSEFIAWLLTARLGSLSSAGIIFLLLGLTPEINRLPVEFTH